MKKLLVLALVLGLTSLVQADLQPIELSINGVYDGPGNVTEVTIQPCQYLTIDVGAPAGLDWGGYCVIDGPMPGSGEWGDAEGGQLNSGSFFLASGYPAAGPGKGADSSIQRYVEENGEGDNWGYGYLISDSQFSGINPGGTVYNFLFHCVGTGTVSISLYNGLSSDYITPDDRVIIHQIPEPATIGLLGLGGLLLRRRK